MAGCALRRVASTACSMAAETAAMAALAHRHAFYKRAADVKIVCAVVFRNAA